MPRDKFEQHRRISAALSDATNHFEERAAALRPQLAAGDADVVELATIAFHEAQSAYFQAQANYHHDLAEWHLANKQERTPAQPQPEAQPQPVPQPQPEAQPQPQPPAPVTNPQ